MTREGIPKLFGLGFCKEGDPVEGGIDSSYTVVDLFDPPELEKGYYGEKQDLWNVGVLLYFMIYGTYPFGSKFCCEYKQCRAQARFDFDENIKVSNSCKDLIRKLLVIDPGHRLSFAEFKAHPFI